MKNRYNGDRNEFRNTVASGGYIDVFEAIYHQKSKNGCRKSFSEIFDKFWGFPFFGKKNKRKKTGDKRCKNAHSDGDYFFGKGHSKPPAFSMGLRKKASIPKIATIVGIIKDSEPKRTRQKTEQKTPIRAV